MDDQTEPTTEVTMEDRVSFLEWCVARLIPEDQQVYLRRLHERVQQKNVKQSADPAPAVEQAESPADPAPAVP